MGRSMPAPRTIRTRLTRHEQLGGDVRRLRLQPLDEPPPFAAGQYLLIETAGGGAPFSIASAPRELPLVELHFQPTPGSEESDRVEAAIEAARRGEHLRVTLPLGDCGITGPLTQPLILIAGGTGITQARSILREHLAASRERVSLYWGVQRPEELYLHEELGSLARDPRLRYVAAVERDPPPGTFAGTVLDAAALDIDRRGPSLEGARVLLCGAPAMVYAAVTRLRPLGLVRAHTASDAFDYAPREDVWD